MSNFLAMITSGRIVLYAAQFLLLYALGTFCFDVVHHLLHRVMDSRVPLLRRFGRMHQVHHDFLGADLRVRDELTVANLVIHRLPEYVTQVFFTLPAFLIFDAVPVVATLGFYTLLLVVGTALRGRDSNHTGFEVLPGTRSGILVDPAYHSLHHVYPSNYVGSFTTAFDMLFATGCQIRGRRFAMTGASGSFGAPFKKLLEQEGAEAIRCFKFGRDYTYEDYSKLDDALRDTDVLVLCHGTRTDRAMQANCDSFVALIERFRELTKDRRLPIEVWAIGSEIEMHPAWGNPELQIYLESKRAFARHARGYFHRRDMVYRHIVPSAFTSPMGRGLISGATAAAIAMFFLKRGFRYVPVTYSGIAFANYFKFLFRVR